MNLTKQKYLRKEIQYLLDNEPSQSEWSSPCILVPKLDGTYRMCTDYRKINNLSKSDSQEWMIVLTKLGIKIYN